MATLSDLLRGGYTPPTESPMTDALANHLKSIPEKFNENQAHQMSLLNQAFPGNTYESMMTQGDPKAMAELAMQTPFNAMIAYHGTPHKILGNFDISKVGTGEGAQAYGHGMYFAENPAVATEYKNILSKPEFTKNAEGIELRGQLPRMLEESYFELTAKNGIQQTNYGDVVDVVKQRLDRQMKDALKSNDMDWYNKVADMKIDLARFKENPPPNTGNLYKVDIPDEYIPNMLDWDKPLSEQPKAVQDALAKYDPDLYSIKGADYDSNELGQNIYQRLVSDESKKARELVRNGQFIDNTSNYGFQNASKRLNELGIKGIRYLDQGSRPVAGGEIIDVFKSPEGWKSKVKVANRGGVGFSDPTDVFTTSMPFKTEAEAKKWAENKINAGTSNFVVFDPSTVKILEENGKPLTRKELIEKQVKELKD